jgi:hypothetical protein
VSVSSTALRTRGPDAFLPLHQRQLRTYSLQEATRRVQGKSNAPAQETCDEHEGIQGQTALSGRVNCDRNVIRRAQDLKKHRRLRTHTGSLSWKVKSLISCALSHVGVRWCRWPASLSKRAPSTVGVYGSLWTEPGEGGAPGWTRTSYPRLRRAVLYPDELRARCRYGTPNAAPLMHPQIRRASKPRRFRPISGR